MDQNDTSQIQTVLERHDQLGAPAVLAAACIGQIAWKWWDYKVEKMMGLWRVRNVEENDERNVEIMKSEENIWIIKREENVGIINMLIISNQEWWYTMHVDYQ